jgi:hypothetical protein
VHKRVFQVENDGNLKCKQFAKNSSCLAYFGFFSDFVRGRVIRALEDSVYSFPFRLVNFLTAINEGVNPSFDSTPTL